MRFAKLKSVFPNCTRSKSFPKRYREKLRQTLASRENATSGHPRVQLGSDSSLVGLFPGPSCLEHCRSRKYTSFFATIAPSLSLSPTK